jgi:hypothetical protein
MTKQMVNKCVEGISRYDMEGSLGNLKKFIENLIEKYGEKAEFDTWIEGDYEFKIYATREETDEEYANRLVVEKKQAEYSEKVQRAQYEELKKKYG